MKNQKEQPKTSNVVCGICGVDYTDGLDGEHGLCRYCQPDPSDNPYCQWMYDNSEEV